MTFFVKSFSLENRNIVILWLLRRKQPFPNSNHSHSTYKTAFLPLFRTTRHLDRCPASAVCKYAACISSPGDDGML